MYKWLFCFSDLKRVVSCTDIPNCLKITSEAGFVDAYCSRAKASWSWILLTGLTYNIMIPKA